MISQSLQKPISYVYDYAPERNYIPSFKNPNEKLEFENNQLKYQRAVKFDTLKNNIQECGRFASINWYCKQCETEGGEALLKHVKKVYETCGVRYCDDPKCATTRFAVQMDKLKKIKRFQFLNNFWHVVIGFPKINLEDFATEKKKQERVLNAFFSKLRKVGIKIQAFKILDISKGKRGEVWDGKYFVHYHLAIIPPSVEMQKKFNIKYQKHREKGLGGLLTEIHSIKEKHLSAQRNKVPFNIESFGYKNKEAIFSYLSLRSSGLYKSFETKGHIEKVEKGQLEKNIKEGKYMMMRDLCSLEFYFNHFYKHRNISFLGDNYKCSECNTEFPLKEVVVQGDLKSCPVCSSVHINRCLPQGSIPMDIVKDKFPSFCNVHGTLTRNQVRRERILIIEIETPPDTTIQEKPTPPSMNVSIVDHRVTPNWNKLGLAELQRIKKVKKI